MRQGSQAPTGGRRAAGVGLGHRYNSVLKRVSHDKSRAEMTPAELEAAIGWMERNRLAAHLHLLEDDPRYNWTARQRGAWSPPVSRLDDGQSRDALNVERRLL